MRYFEHPDDDGSFLVAGDDGMIVSDRDDLENIRKRLMRRPDIANICDDITYVGHRCYFWVDGEQLTGERFLDAIVLLNGPKRNAASRLQSHHFTDENGCPNGGCTVGKGFSINWQAGAMVKDGQRLEQNGAFVQHVIEAAIDRLEYYQQTKFASVDNAEAIGHLCAAIGALSRRTQGRKDRGVEGTHEI